MQILIDIPEKTNNRIRSYLGHGYCIRDEDVKIIAEAIYNGKALEQLPSAEPEDIYYVKFSEEDYEKIAEQLRKIPIVLTFSEPEIIRCGECKHSFLHDNGEKISRICGLTRMCGTTPDDWFCADAERREE